MNEDVEENRKLFLKMVNNAKREKVERCSRIKDGTGTLTPGDSEVRRIWKKYLVDQYNIDTQEKVTVWF